MRTSYGHGGWTRIDAEEDLPGPLYLRFGLEGGARPVLTEVYLDGRGSEITPAMLRKLKLTDLAAFVVAGETSWLHGSVRLAGPDLSRLASYFATSFGRRATGWIADSWRAQITGSGVQSPKRVADRKRDDVAPPPLEAPMGGLTDAFLEDVGRAYGWAVRNGLRPAVELARQAGVEVRTVHAWVYKARKRGIMPPTRQGSVF